MSLAEQWAKWLDKDARQGPDGNWYCKCPTHNDGEASFSIKDKPAAHPVPVVFRCWRDCSRNGLIAEFQRRGWWPLKEAQSTTRGGKKAEKDLGEKISYNEYDYRDADGTVLYQSVAMRYTKGKKMWQRRPDGSGGWINSLGEIKRVLFMLPELLAAVEDGESIFIVEGEEKVKLLRSWGLHATCNPQGAGKWDDKYHYSDCLKGAQCVYVLPDYDADGKGMKHAETVCRSVARAGIPCKLVHLPGLAPIERNGKPKGQDVVDWAAKGNGIEQLWDLCVDAPAWTDASEEGDHVGDSVATDSDENTNRAKRTMSVDNAELWMDEDGEGYVTVNWNGHVEHHKIASKAFEKLWMADHFKTFQKGAGRQKVNDALLTLQARAFASADKRPTAVRFASHDGCIYIDLCREDWRVVQIDTHGFRVIEMDECPVMFRRRSSLRPLPEPQQVSNAEALEELRKMLNVSRVEFRLSMTCLSAYPRQDVPQPILTVDGVQGSGKSFFCERLRKMIDPHKTLTRSLPKDEHNLAVSIENNAILVFDNISNIPAWLSDALCRIATGSGFGTRLLYENDEEQIFTGIRGVILNGIGDSVVFDDLAERRVPVSLSEIPDVGRKEVVAMASWFDKNHPRLLGALCWVISQGLKNLPSVTIDKLPRMADFAKWGCSVASALGWTADEFLETYRAEKSSAQQALVENSALGKLLISLMARYKDNPWTGTATELLAALKGELAAAIKNASADESDRKQLPAAPQSLSAKLKRLAPALKSQGIYVEFPKRKGDSRSLTLSNSPNPIHDDLDSSDDLHSEIVTAPRYSQSHTAWDVPNVDDDHDDDDD